MFEMIVLCFIILTVAIHRSDENSTDAPNSFGISLGAIQGTVKRGVHQIPNTGNFSSQSFNSSGSILSRLPEPYNVLEHSPSRLAETSNLGKPNPSILDDPSNSGGHIPSIFVEPSKYYGPISSTLAEPSNSGGSISSILAELSNSGGSISSILAEPSNSGISISSILAEPSNSGGSISSILAEPSNSGGSISSILAEPSNSGGSISSILAEPSNSGGRIPSILVEPSKYYGPISSLLVDPSNSGVSISSILAEPSNLDGSISSILAEPSNSGGSILSRLPEPYNALGHSPSRLAETSNLGKPNPPILDEPSNLGGRIPSLLVEPSKYYGPISSILVDPSNTGGSISSILAEPSNTGISISSILAEPSNSGGSISSILAEPSNSGGSISSILAEPSNSDGHIPSRLELIGSVHSRLAISSDPVVSALSRVGVLNPSSEQDVFSESGTSLLGFGDTSNLEWTESGLDITQQRTCCSTVPSVCNDDGHCTLGMATCVKLCLCLTEMHDPLCEETLNNLAQQLADTTTPENIQYTNLSPLVVDTNTTETVHHADIVAEAAYNSTELVNLHSKTTVVHLNDTVMFGNDDTHKSTSSMHSVDSIVRVPLSNHVNMSHLSGGGNVFQTEDNTNLTEQYRIPKQTHSDPRKAQLSYLVIKQTTSHTPSSPLISDQTTHDSSGHLNIGSVFRKRRSSLELPTTRDIASHVGSPELSTGKYFRSSVGFPEVLASEYFRLYVGSPEQSTSKDFRSSVGSPGLLTTKAFPSLIKSSKLPTSKDLPLNTHDLFILGHNAMPNEISLPTLSSADGDNIKDHPCENCSGVCRLVFFPSYKMVCEETEVDKCKNFNCGNHGTCVVSNVTGLVSCSCDDMYTGTFCENFCDLDCGNDGKCSFINNSTTCVCNWNHTGEFCELIKMTLTPKTRVLGGHLEPVPWHLIGVCLALLVLLFLVCLVFPYWSWHRRWLPMRKLVHYFQSYEEDDGKLYDAFVSYKSSKQDEHFVVHKLFPKLEKELEFKLCLHFRDFPPGETIADNIIQAIENSRRTILILSPNFVQSEWCRLEYQKAQQEMLKLKHKIIPIMLQDISNMTDVDKNLKQIMNTVTFIEWPGDEVTKRVDKFWQLMQCSMPKKTPGSDRSERSLWSCSSQKPMTSQVESCRLQSFSDDVFPSSESSSSSVNMDSQKVSDSNVCDKHLKRTTLFIENETNKSNHNTRKSATKIQTAISESNSFSRSINCVSDKAQACDKSDDNLIQIQRLRGNKIKLWKVSPANLESH